MTVINGGKAEPKVAGLVKMSTTDWPGKLAAVVFLQGCPWRCVYCHNEAILDPKAPAATPWSEVLKFLERRRGLLDGVVFSGGEPLIDAALPDAIRTVRAMGFQIGMHTGGAWPKRLAALAENNLLDWVGLDIKHLKDKYSQVTGVKVSGKAAFESLEIIVQSGIAHETRTTVDPTVHTHDDGVELIGQLRDYRSANGNAVQKHVLQEARANGAAAGHADAFTSWRLRHLIAEHEAAAQGVAIRAA
jgi:pyruvate formate lyase activating enzyme